jgi:hypothetical protein
MKFIIISLLAITGAAKSCGKPSVTTVNTAHEVAKNVKSKSNSDNNGLEFKSADSICDKFLNEISKENKHVSYDNSNNTITINNIY